MVTTKTSATALSISVLLFGASLAGAAYLAPQGKKAPKKPPAGKSAKPAAGAVADAAAMAAVGKKIYDANGCAVCHAIGGKGGQAGPDLTKTGANAQHTTKWFEDQVKNPKLHTQGSTMPAYEGKIKGKDLTALAVYLTTLGGTAGGSTGNTAVKPTIKVQPPSPAVIAKIEKSGGSVRQIAMSDPRLEIDFHLTGASVTDAALVPLAGVKGVVELNLGKTSVTDAGLVHIKGLTDLTTLHLEGTKITDKGLVNLKGLKNLTYLNVYNTAVTDEGLNQLAGLANLKQLYVWQTKVTKAGADKLKTALPKVEVVMGWDADAKPEVKKQ